MNQEIINEVVCQMMPHLSNDQVALLRNVLERLILRTSADTEKDDETLIASFLSAKRLEGCSDRTLNFYKNTIDKMYASIGKSIKAITTEDLRNYLSEYQSNNEVSKVTIDNIRRNLSSFFAWLEDENYILKSPVRRIHRVKATTSIKETYTDEDLEKLRDSCVELRDLALIDILASTGMRVGELVRLNRSDINFTERECVVFGNLFNSAFMEEIAKMPEKNLSIELLKKLIAEQVKLYKRTNIVKSQQFSEMLDTDGMRLT